MSSQRGRESLARPILDVVTEGCPMSSQRGSGIPCARVCACVQVHTRGRGRAHGRDAHAGVYMGEVRRPAGTVRAFDKRRAYRLRRAKLLPNDWSRTNESNSPDNVR